MNENDKVELITAAIYCVAIVFVFSLFFGTIIYGIKSGNEKQIRIQEIQTYGETIEK